MSKERMCLNEIDIMDIMTDFYNNDKDRVVAYSVSSSISKSLPLLSGREYNGLLLVKKAMKVNLNKWVNNNIAWRDIR
jgi:hypothetical protein